jgi:hypothetical protein
MEPSKIILLVVVILVIFLIGGGAGIMYQAQKSVLPQSASSQGTPPVLKQLSSKVFPLITASGKVADVSGRNITVSFSGDSTTIKIKDGAPVYSFGIDSKGVSQQQLSDFSQIKKESNINISCKLLADGTLEGQAVVILPASSPNLP